MRPVEQPAAGPLRRSRPAQGPRPPARCPDDLPFAAVTVLAGGCLYAAIALRAGCAEQAVDRGRADTTLRSTFSPAPAAFEPVACNTRRPAASFMTHRRQQPLQTTPEARSGPVLSADGITCARGAYIGSGQGNRATRALA